MWLSYRSDLADVVVSCLAGVRCEHSTETGCGPRMTSTLSAILRGLGTITWRLVHVKRAIEGIHCKYCAFSVYVH